MTYPGVLVLRVVYVNPSAMPHSLWRFRLLSLRTYLTPYLLGRSCRPRWLVKAQDLHAMLVQALRFVEIEDVETDFHSLGKVRYDFEVEPYRVCSMITYIKCVPWYWYHSKGWGHTLTRRLSGQLLGCLIQKLNQIRGWAALGLKVLAEEPQMRAFGQLLKVLIEVWKSLVEFQ